MIRSNYWQPQQALMDRSNTTNVRDIESEISANEEAGEHLLKLVSKNGTMSDVDRLKVHIKEVESVTNLLLVLHERLQRVEDELKQADDVKEKVNDKYELEHSASFFQPSLDQIQLICCNKELVNENIGKLEKQKRKTP